MAIQEADRCASQWVQSGKLRRLSGNLVVEYLPNIAAHKGDATMWIAQDVEERLNTRAWTVFVGDDVTDEDAFKAITHGISVLVGARDTHASHRVADVNEVCSLLDWLMSHQAMVRR